MTPWYADDAVTVWHGDCLTVLADMADCSVDAVCTDPPYGLGFMGKDWDRGAMAARTEAQQNSILPAGGQAAVMWRPTDYQQWCQTWAEHCLRILKPGGHLLAFGGTRTHHRLACAIEDAGFEIRDSIAWLYGSGFPKSLDVGKAIDRAAGAERNDARHEGFTPFGDGSPRCLSCGKTKGSQPGNCRCVDLKSAPATPEAQQWNGWGTALKPAHEPIVVARKPLAGTVAANVLIWGTGALNIDAGRVPHANAADLAESEGKNRHADYGTLPGGNEVYGDYSMVPSRNYDGAAGRWPPNVALDPHTAAALDQQSGISGSNSGQTKVSTGRKTGDGSWTRNDRGMFDPDRENVGVRDFGDSGGASRFFPVFRHEQTCALFGMLSGCERTLLASSTTPAHTANAASATSPATDAASALEDAPTRSVEWRALDASSAETLCGSCATAIARSVAAISLGRSATQVLGLPSTADSSERILNRSFALIAEDLAKLATTSITTDLTTSLGCVVDAISTYTIRAFRHERRRSAPSSDLPLWRYEPKAPTLERPRAPQEGAAGEVIARTVKQCSTCGSKTIAAGPGGEPACGHGTWTHVDISVSKEYAAHPTVKPLDLMRWLVRLVTPPGGLVLDPFLGSGTTAEACIVEGFRCVGVEREDTYLPMIRARLTKPIQPVLDLGEL